MSSKRSLGIDLLLIPRKLGEESPEFQGSLRVLSFVGHLYRQCELLALHNKQPSVVQGVAVLITVSSAQRAREVRIVEWLGWARVKEIGAVIV
jgi:hypothetical protein